MNEFDDQISDALHSHAAHIEVQPAGFEDVRRRARLRRARFAGLAVVPVLVAAAYVSGATRSNRTDIGVASDGTPPSESADIVCSYAVAIGGPLGEAISGTVPAIGPDATERPEYPLATEPTLPATTLPPASTSVEGGTATAAPMPSTGALVGSGVVSIGGTTNTVVSGEGVLVAGDPADPCLTVDLDGATGVTQCVVVGTVDTTVPRTDGVPTTPSPTSPATTTTTVVSRMAPDAAGGTSLVSNGTTTWSCTGAATAASGDCSVLFPGFVGEPVPVTTDTSADSVAGTDEPLTVVGCEPGTATSCTVVDSWVDASTGDSTATPTTVTYSAGGTTYRCSTGSLDTGICAPVTTPDDTVVAMGCTTPAEPVTTTSLG